MPRTFAVLFTLATLSAAAHAQSSDPAVNNNQGNAPYSSSQPAPVERPYGAIAPGMSPYGQGGGNQYGAPQYNPMQRPGRAAQSVVDSSPVAGVWVRSGAAGDVETVATSEHATELRVIHGRVNVDVHHPADHAMILVDLPGGQVSLLKDGLYTFNGDTNTVRVLHGEAEAYPGGTEASPNGVKGLKVKEDHQVGFTTAPGKVRSVDAYPYELTSDLLRGEGGEGGGGYRGNGFEGGYGFGYGYPGYGFGYPGYGYGYGYPFGLGLGFGYYGGFGGYRGGFGGYGGGFGGRGFRR